MTGLTKSFGGVRALDGVNLTAEPGKITAILGANGAGKTTLLNAVSGFVRADEGTVFLGDRQLSGLSPHQVNRLGVSRTFQTPIIPRTMSGVEVVESGRLGLGRTRLFSPLLRLPQFRRERNEDRRTAMVALSFVGLAAAAQQDAQSLPLGARRLLEVARAVAREPGVMLLDEPAAGLDAEGRSELDSLMCRTRDAGGTVVIVEHNVNFVLGIADHVHVMERGRVLASGTPDEIRINPEVIASYLGANAATRITTDNSLPDKPRDAKISSGANASAEEHPGDAPGTSAVTEPVLQVDGICLGYGDLTAVWDASFQLRPGRTTAVLGHNGAGKTTLLSGIAGLLPCKSGSIHLVGEDITRLPVHQRVEKGLGLVQEGKRIFRDLTVRDNLVLAQRHSNRDEEVLEGMYSRFPALGVARNKPAGGLSGGQQQMLAIAQALVRRPTVLLLDEPAAGLAPVVVDEILELIDELKHEGIAIVLVEQIIENVLTGTVDEVIVISQGRVALQANAADLSVESIAEVMLH